MANMLLGALANIVSCANDRVVDAYYLVAEIAHRRTRLIVRILIFAMDRWTILSAVQDVFLGAKKKRRNKPAYNRMDHEIKQMDRKYRVAVTRNSGNTAVRAAVSTSAKPALPETSAVSSNARATDWKTLDALRTGPPTCQKTGKKGSSDGA